MTGTPTYPIYGTHNDPVCSRAFSTSMLFNNPIISVGSQAPTAILAYLAVRGTSPGPLFLLKDGTTLTRQKLVKMVQSTLQLAGIDPSGYSGHSFRIGAATTTAAKGIDADTIRTLGRWSSDTYQRYIQIPCQELAIISQQIAKP